jgi:hypothetical protein
MKNKHISFSKISDLCDENILSKSEREDLRDHLDRCENCRREYGDLDSMLKMLNGMRSLRIRDEADFIANTLEVIKQRRVAKRKVSIIRYSSLSAIAATIIVVISFGIYNFSAKMDREQIAKEVEREEPYDSSLMMGNYKVLRTNYDIGKVLLILDKNNTEIFDISDSYVVGETGLSNYRNLKRELDNRIIGESFGKGSRPIRETGRFDYEIIGEDWPYLNEGNSTVKFRVNLK